MIEDVSPAVDSGRFAVKRIVGDAVGVRAAIFADGHDHIGTRILYRREGDDQWRHVKMHAMGNDVWEGVFVPDAIGLWHFRIEGWIDHFSTWVADLAKRISAQAETTTPSLESGGTATTTSQDISLALLTGAQLLYNISIEVDGTDAGLLQNSSRYLQKLAESGRVISETPVTRELQELVERNPNRHFSTQTSDFPVRADRKRACFSTWYEFFPRSASGAGQHGTLRDAALLVPGLADTGFDVIYLPPIHPIGTAYRKGKNNTVHSHVEDVGSPWAIGNRHGGHTAIAAELGGFTDFDALVEAARNCSVEIALDIAFQCSPDHPWVKSHPDWFLIRPDGSIQYAENPPKKYQDIYPLNFESNDWRNLWEELFGVFLFWIKRGIRIFRVDNPHTKALPFWEWCIDRIQRSYPDVIFLSEAFTRPHLMYGLAKRGFSQSYTYFSWRNTKDELVSYLTELKSEPICDFFRPNFWPNTPDILPIALQKGGRAAFIQRAVLAATLGASYGVYGPAFELMESRPLKEGSEEYRDSEKYQLRKWDRNRSDSLMPLLGTLNKARHEHSSLQQNSTLQFHGIDNPLMICYSKRDDRDLILVIVNLDSVNAQSGWTELDLYSLGLSPEASFECHDLLREHRYTWNGPRNYVLLDPLDLPAHIFHIQLPGRENGAVGA